MRIYIGKMAIESLAEEFGNLIYDLGNGKLLSDKEIARGIYLVEEVSELEENVLCDQCPIEEKMAVVMMGDTLALCKDHLKQIILGSSKLQLTRVTN